MQDRESRRAKQRYDQKVRCSWLESGNLVLLRQKAFQGKHKIIYKIADMWENELYAVIKQQGNMPFYKVIPKNGTGRV